MTSTAPPPLSWKALHPKNWAAWLTIGSLFVLSLLPSRLSWFIGRWLGRLASLTLNSRRNIAEQNIQLCFPELSVEQQKSLLRHQFDCLGLAIIDTATAWFWPQWRFDNHMQFEGVEHLKSLRQQSPNTGILLISMHFYNLEWVARMFGCLEPGIGVYRPNNNSVYEHFQHKARIRCNRALLDRRDIRGMLRTLKQGGALWFLPDHDYGRRGSVFTPFFQVPDAATVSTTGTLARVKGTRCLLIYAKRDYKKRSYTLVIEPISSEYPTGDELSDTTAMNQLIEQTIRKQPEEYMWIHRRFKTRPKGQAKLYD